MVEETLQNQVDEMRKVQVRKAGRQLPRRIRKDAQVVVSAMSLVDNPKTARMLDTSEAMPANHRPL